MTWKKKSTFLFDSVLLFGLLLLINSIFQTLASADALENVNGVIESTMNEQGRLTSSPPLASDGLSPFADESCVLLEVICSNEIYAIVTAFNPGDPNQNSGDACIAANGENICGRTDVAACPRSLRFGAVISVNGKRYTCVDRMARKNDGRFDLSFGSNLEAAKAFGRQYLPVTVYESENRT